MRSSNADFEPERVLKRVNWVNGKRAACKEAMI
jgi:hypothetical protein